MIRERPIIMSAESVRAILAGRKTQSRRVMRERDVERLGLGLVGIAARIAPDIRPGPVVHSGCPYGAAGSRLWVKESFARVWAHVEGPSDADRIEYRADTDAKRPGGWDAERDAPKGARWISPLYMPRALSRITLEILSVRVERVQAISDADARAEGFPIGEPVPVRVNGERVDMVVFDPRYAFAAAWDAINGRRAGCSWASSPWVWVLEFRRVEGT